MSENEMETLAAEIRRGRTQLVRTCILLSVTEASKEALDASVAALQAHYSDLGITADVLADEQKEAWLQGLACDVMRTEDLAHIMDAEGFFGSWFWGGSITGEAEGPAIGHTTGATASLVRLHPTEAPRRGDTSSDRDRAWQRWAREDHRDHAADRPRCGLTEGAWVPLLDLKGDLDNRYGGIVACAKEYDILAEAVAIDGRFSGVADLLRLSSLDEALSAAHGQLMLLISEALRVRAQPVLMEHISRIIETGEERSTAHLIETMAASGDDTAQRIAAELAAWRNDVYGAAIVGKLDGGEPLGTGAGIHLIRCPGMVPVPSSIPASEWSTSQRVQSAVIRGLLAWLTQVGARQNLRGMRKIVCLPEAHLHGHHRGGRLPGAGQPAWAARWASLSSSTPKTPGRSRTMTASWNQLVSVFAFSQDTEAQQTALAQLLGSNPHGKPALRCGTCPSIHAPGANGPATATCVTR